MKYTKRSRNAKGQFTVMSFKDRMVTLSLISLSLCFNYITHYRSTHTTDLVSPYVEAREVQPTVTPTEIQPSDIEPVEEVVEAPELSQKEEIIAYIVEVFGEDAPEAFNVLRCENKNLNPEAENWNSNGTWDAGIFQINQVHGFTMEQMKDYKQNIDYAHKLFTRQGWTPWSCSHRVDVTPFYLKG